jgi:hypothetical protein
MNNTITFATHTQAAIWNEELIGQISDGQWENTNNTDWEKWCDADVEVGSEIGRNFKYVKKDNFMFNSKKLIEIVGDRMVVYAILGDFFKNAQVKLDVIEYTLNVKIDNDYNITDVTLTSNTGEFWDKRRAYVESIGFNEIKKVLIESPYNLKSLRADLRAISKTIKTVK